MSRPLFDDRVTFAPFLILEYEASRGVYGLILFDDDMEDAEDVFGSHGAEGNGHGWEGLAESLVKSRMPEAAGLLEFNSEGGTFAVDSGDLGALQRLAVLLHQAFHDHDLLAQLIGEADPDLLPR